MSTHRKKAFKAKDYLAEEEGTIIKSGRGHPLIALIYPNTYFLGMSNLGFQAVYSLFNADPDCICERVFLPDDNVLQGSLIPKSLRTFESSRVLTDVDALAFSISFENDYLNLMTIFHLAGLPARASERSENDPIVIAGGAAITINPEPIRPFCDILFVGEAEEAVIEVTEVLRSSLSKKQKIKKLGTIEGCYVCDDIDNSKMTDTRQSSICPSTHFLNSLESRVSLEHLRQYKRRVPHNINDVAIESIIHTTYSEFGKLQLIEVQRGCGRGCKFCAEGFIYTPFRQRRFDLIKEQVLRGLQSRDKIGLIGADLLVYPEIVELFEFIHANGGTFSPSSVRVDGLTPEIISLLAKSGHRTLAIAPEAGSDELRRRTNKKFDNNAILNVIDQLILAGIPNIKMYLMIGLPFETAKDIEDTIELIDRARQIVMHHAKKSGRAGQLILSLNPFIPKPRTPYQVGVFEGIDALEVKIERTKKALLPKGGIRIYYENPFYAYVQALLSNGTTHMSHYLEEVFKNGGKLKQALKSFAL